MAIQQIFIRTFFTVAMVLLLSRHAGAQPELKLGGFADSRAIVSSEEEASSLDLHELELDMLISGEAGEEGRLIRLNPEADNNGLRFEQAYVQIPIDRVTSGTFTAGRINSPIGFEDVDPISPLDLRRRHNISHSVLFERGLQSRFDGFMYSLEADPVEFNLFLGAELEELNFIGWRVYLIPEDLPKNLGAYVGKFWQLGIGGTHSLDDEVGDNNPEKRINVDLAINVGGKLKIGAEYNTGSDEDGFGESRDWRGFMLSTRYDINDQWGIAARFDSFDDGDRVRGLGDKLSRFVLTPSWSFSPEFDCKAEWRYEVFDQVAGFADGDGKAAKDRNIVTLQWVYSFERRPKDLIFR